MSNEPIAALILTHVQRYAEIDILDIYKLLHQAVFGPGHAVKNVKPAREWLERESEILQPGPVQPLLENIHPQQALVRVHLRPYLALKGSLGKLLDGFVESSKTVHGDTKTMAAWWKIFEDMANPGGSLAGRFDTRQIALIGRSRLSENWPASHHSPAFQVAYKPAYRVLTRSLAEAMLRVQKLPVNLT